MATVSIDYFGMPGSGRNVTEAKRDAGRKLQEAMTGSYNPVLLHWRGYCIFVWRTPNGWESTVTHDPEGEFGVIRKEGTLYGGTHADCDREEVVRRCWEHLAQLGWKHEDGTNPPPFLKDRRSIADFKTWAEFQIRFKAARERGMSDDDAHSYAGRNPARPQLWMHEEKQSA